MEGKMKKFLALVLALSMVLALAACGSEGSSESTTKAADAAGEASQAADTVTEAANGEDTAAEVDVADLPHYKIGIICHTNSGGCWERIYDAAQYVAENLNCEVSAAVGSNADSCISAADNFIAAGVDGLIFLADGGVTARLIDMCSEYGIYLAFSGCNLTVTEEDGFDEFSKNEYYVGNFAHDEYGDSFAGAQVMIDNGAKNFVIYGLPPGIGANFDLRFTGAEAAIDEADLTYEEVRSFTLAQVSPTIMSQYPDTDAIFGCVTTPDSFNVEDFAAEYGDKVQVSGYMCGDVTHEFEIGFMSQVCVAEEAQIEMTMAALYNAMSGHRLAEADGTAPVVEFSHLWIDNLDDYKTFISNTTGGNYAYDFDQVKEWINVLGGNPTIDGLADVASAFSSHDDDGWLAQHR